MLTCRIKTTPTSEPVTLAEAKAHARVDIDDDDALFATMISAARQQAEFITGQVLSVSEWALTGWIEAESDLPIIPCLNVVSVTAGGNAVSDDLYAFTPSQLPRQVARFTPLPGFPSGEVELTVRAGYESGQCPESIKQWILTRVSTWYEQREKFVVGANFNELSRDFVDSLLDPYIVPRGF